MLKLHITTLFITLTLLCNAQAKRNNVFDSTLASYLNKKCNNNLYSVINGKVYRQYDNEKYRLIDTCGIIIYVKRNYKSSALDAISHKSVLEAFFSMDFDSAIQYLDFDVLKEQFKSYPDFFHALKKIKDKEYFAKPDSSGITTVNQLYRQYVRNEH